MKVFINLPVADLDRSKRFFEALGYHFNQQFTDPTAACLVMSDDIFAMLMTHEKFRGFSPNPICDAKKSTEVLVCLSADSREEVDEVVRKAVAAGGTTYARPQDHGFMYGHGFQDLDGHVWEYCWMDPAVVQPDPQLAAGQQA